MASGDRTPDMADPSRSKRRRRHEVDNDGPANRRSPCPPAVGHRLDQRSCDTTDAEPGADPARYGALFASARPGGDQRCQWHRPGRGDTRAPADQETGTDRQRDPNAEGFAGYVVPGRGDAARHGGARERRRSGEQDRVGGDVAA